MATRVQTFLDYDGFVEKFKPKKTTDDCYTPANVYEAVRAWAVKEYGLEGREIVRPFWPGKEYDCFDYPDGCVVIDNPPFSILAKIIRWYYAQKVDFFLFAPALTIGSSVADKCNIVIPPCKAVTFANGAVVRTAFATNLGEYAIQVRPDLAEAIAAANEANIQQRRGTNPQRTDHVLELPPEVVTPARLLKLKADWRVKRGDCLFIPTLDGGGRDFKLFGGGYLLSERAAAERAAAERAAAERAAAERAAATVWELSPRERELQKLLGGHEIRR